MHTKLLILLALASCLYAASDSNSTTPSDETTIEPSSSTTPSPSSTTTSSPSSNTTSSPSSNTTSSPSSNTTSSPSSNTTSSPSFNTTCRPNRPPIKPHRFPGFHRPSRPSRPSSHPHHLRPSRPSGRPGSPRPLPIPRIATEGLKIADSIAKGFISTVFPSVPPSNRGGPRPRHPRALNFDFIDPLQIIKVSGSLNQPTIPDWMNAMIQEASQSLPNSSNTNIPEISPFQTIPIPIPGLEDALDAARNNVTSYIGSDGDMADAIQSSMQDALDSDDPAEAIHDLCAMVLDVYSNVARKCPLIIAKKIVMAEAFHCIWDIINILRNLSSGEN